jgi:hypothetical protein
MINLDLTSDKKNLDPTIYIKRPGISSQAIAWQRDDSILFIYLLYSLPLD